MCNINSALHYSFSLARSNVATAISSTQVLHMPVRTCVCVQQPTIRTSIARAGPKHQEPVSTFVGFQKSKAETILLIRYKWCFQEYSSEIFCAPDWHSFPNDSAERWALWRDHGVILWNVFKQRLEVICVLEAHFLECSSWYKSA